MNAAIAMTPVGSLLPLASPVWLAPDRTDVPLPDASQVATNGGDAPRDTSAYELLFAQLDPDWSVWDALTATSNEGYGQGALKIPKGVLSKTPAPDAT